MSNMTSIPPDNQPAPYNQQTYDKPQNPSGSIYFYLGIICTVLSMIVFPEIFGSAAIISDAYLWRMERPLKSNRGLIVILVALLAMFIGLYYTSLIALYNFLP